MTALHGAAAKPADLANAPAQADPASLASPTDAPAAAIDIQALNRRLTLHLVLPFLVLIVLNSLDRVNIGFAAIRMNADLGFSPATYGFGVGLFFAGYMLAQVPSMWLLQRYGMRRWMTGVVLAWGLVATLMAFVSDATSFFALRFALGLAEAGFAPGVTWCCARWMPQRLRGGAIGLTMVAIPLSVIIGGPLSGALMDMGNPLGLPGWRWMILAEGLPTVLLGAAVWFYMVDSPGQAAWLSPAQRQWLADTLAAEASQRAAAPAATRAATGAGPAAQGTAAATAAMLRSGLFWACALAWFSLLTGAYGMIYWLPLVIKQVSGQGATMIGLLSALPWLGVALGMVLNPRHSDRTGERHLHIALPALASALALCAAAWAGNSAWALGLLVLWPGWAWAPPKARSGPCPPPPSAPQRCRWALRWSIWPATWAAWWARARSAGCARQQGHTNGRCWRWLLCWCWGRWPCWVCEGGRWGGEAISPDAA